MRLLNEKYLLDHNSKFALHSNPSNVLKHVKHVIKIEKLAYDEQDRLIKAVIYSMIASRDWFDKPVGIVSPLFSQAA